MTASHSGRPPLSSRQAVGDVVLAVVVTAAAVWIHAAGVDAIPINSRPNLWSVLLTVAAVAPLAVRRARPLAVLAVCLPGPLLLVAGHYSVGASPLGVVVAFYTAIAWGSRREARAAVPVLLLAVSIAVALRPIDLSVEGALVQLALYVGGWVIGTGVRERRELDAVRTSEDQRELELARRQAELERERASRATAEERLRITRELHDVLGHAFSVMVVQAGAAEQLLDADPAAVRAALREIGSTGRSSLADIRRVLGQLREGEEQLRLEPSPSLADLPALVARVAAAGLPTRLRLDADLDGSCAGVELAAYRVVQEALTNCLKHASADNAEVVVGLDGQGSGSAAGVALWLEVWDDGLGAGTDVGTCGHGISGMRERVSVYGGTLSAGPGSDGGYRVSARIPLVAERRAGVS